MRSRVLTALAGMPIVLGAVFFANPFPFLALLIATFLLASLEFDALLGEKRGKAKTVIVTCLFAVLAYAWQTFGQGIAPFAILLLGLATGVWSLYARLTSTVKSHSMHGIPELFGWVGAPLIALALMHRGSPMPPWNFRSLLLMVLLPLWAGDTAAILVGIKWGRRPLAPEISPKKTVEGGIANLIAALIVSCAFGQILSLPLWAAVTNGLAIGTLGQWGDLFESWAKRQTDLKDSGSILPGHGGILDRIDSLLFVAIPSAVIFAFLGK